MAEAADETRPPPPPLVFSTVEEAVAVLGQYTTRARLEALESLGVDLDRYTHRQLADHVRASREKVTVALTSMGRRRKPGRRPT